MTIVTKVLDFGQRAFATTAAVVTAYLSVDVGYRLYSVRAMRQAFQDTEEGQAQITQWKLDNPDPKALKEVTAKEQLEALKARGVLPADATIDQASAVPSTPALPDVSEEERRENLRRAREDYAKRNK